MNHLVPKNNWQLMYMCWRMLGLASTLMLVTLSAGAQNSATLSPDAKAEVRYGRDVNDLNDAMARVNSDTTKAQQQIADLQ